MAQFSPEEIARGARLRNIVEGLTQVGEDERVAAYIELADRQLDNTSLSVGQRQQVRQYLRDALFFLNPEALDH